MSNIELSLPPTISSGPNGGNCVEVERNADGKVLIRETDQVPSVTVVTTPENFARFIEGVKAGKFDQYAQLPEALAAV